MVAHRKLSDAQIEYIITLYRTGARTSAQVASQFNISPGYVRMLAQGKKRGKPHAKHQPYNGRRRFGV